MGHPTCSRRAGSFTSTPAKTHDHQYQAWKFFRTDSLTHEHWRLESPDLSELLGYYRDYIRAWQQSIHRPSTKNYQLTFDNGQSIIKKTGHCARFIDTIILSFQLPDFNHLQIEWSKNIPKLEELIETLTIEKRVQSIESTHDRLKGLASQTIPLIKLIHTLFIKISNPRKKELPFDLLTELSTITLDQLKDLPSRITSRLKLLTQLAKQTIPRNGLMHLEEHHIRFLVNNEISQDLNTFLMLLAFNILPVDPDPDPHSLEDNFQDWFLTWKSIWDSVSKEVKAIWLETVQISVSNLDHEELSRFFDRMDHCEPKIETWKTIIKLNRLASILNLDILIALVDWIEQVISATDHRSLPFGFWIKIPAFLELSPRLYKAYNLDDGRFGTIRWRIIRVELECGFFHEF
ncbi:hypothetical protein H4Q26_008634 [Puccinia striiformis f. sp. tritici PST-130]|nr:hypothetical protein H4Q26_008634 [Puccinia striiformis f. sp. tritici PST-130]